ncbi:hypothetical protein [Paraburkholderia sp. GAS42]|uniref:hypothetical protein n=1 Tax=Paraburkholderia sp. GAS42 TaxID=3035135 RepID=UPI003D246AA5
MLHESVFSAYARFSHLNVLNVELANNLFNLRPFFHRGLFGHSISFDTSGFEAATGWSLVDLQTKTSRDYPNLANLLFADSVRVCYSCLADGYHSVWHQFRLLRRCPIHDSELGDECAHCEGKLSLKMNYYGTLNDEPLLRCPKCGGAPAYRQFSIDRYSAFRAQASRVEKAFAPLQQWFEAAQNRFWIVEELLKQNEPVAWTTWCDLGSFLWSVVNELEPLPDIIDRPQLVPVNWHHWEQNEIPKRTYKDDFRNTYALSSPAVYRVLLRRLNRWVYGEDAPAQVHEDLVQLFSPQGLDASGREALETSLVLFRGWYEIFTEMQSSWANPRRAVLSERFPSNRIGDWLSRRAQYAILMGSFAVILRLVKTRKSPVYFAKEFVDDEIKLPFLLPIVQLPAKKDEGGQHGRLVCAVICFEPD